MILKCEIIKLNNVNFIAKKSTPFPFWLLYNINLVYFHPKRTFEYNSTIAKNNNFSLNLLNILSYSNHH
jgi:hypothetical protein